MLNTLPYRRTWIVLGIASALALLVGPTSATAGLFTSIAITGEVDSGVHAGKTYTHAIDFGKGTDTVVNGQTFTGGNFSGPTYALIDAEDNYTGYGNSATGTLNSLLSDFHYTGSGSGNASLTLNGLTPGTSYITTFYNAAFASPSPRVVNVSVGGDSINYNENSDPVNLLRYEYTAAASSVTFNFDAAVDSDSYHHYGFSNEVAGTGQFSVKPLTGDADSGISTQNVYTHAVDFNSNDGGSVVNGVQLVAGGTSMPGSYTLRGATSGFDNDTSNVTGGIGDAMDDFFYNGVSSGVASLTLEGLTAGQAYRLTLYGTGFGSEGLRFVDILSDTGGGFIDNIDENLYGEGNGIMINYDYVALDNTMTLTFDALSNGDTFHFYAFTNQVVPEPSTLVLAGVGLLGVGWTQWRKRRAT